MTDAIWSRLLEVRNMSVLARRFTILALGSALFAFAMAGAVEMNRHESNRYQPLAYCSTVSGYKCVSSL